MQRMNSSGGKVTVNYWLIVDVPEKYVFYCRKAKAVLDRISKESVLPDFELTAAIHILLRPVLNNCLYTYGKQNIDTPIVYFKRAISTCKDEEFSLFLRCYYSILKYIHQLPIKPIDIEFSRQLNDIIIRDDKFKNSKSLHILSKLISSLQSITNDNEYYIQLVKTSDHNDISEIDATALILDDALIIADTNC
ncbi:hypothetical protein GJ496_008916 [Pomphorhynchus laevis]|nr:hypothetical protein GJ496_008916 [Pomphorhynchus laevis]